MEIPKIIYGTAWKEDATKKLTTMALQAGYRAIDTANQRKHYHEVGVGQAVSEFLQNHERKELFLQTKFTSLHGQDHRLPYDVNADYPLQVRQSIQSSLKNLEVDFVDSYILHGPLSPIHLLPDDLNIWKEMENQCKQGTIKQLGISNINLHQLQELFKQAEIKPSFVQNRCYASQGWDQDIRNFCSKNNIIYQGFSLLTANPHVLMNEKVKQIAQKHQITPAQAIFSFARQIGMLPLTGTSNITHMQQDLTHKNLSPQDLSTIEHIDF
jgi:diketogulonate reductase-like aldo/keto reductase